MDIAEQVGGAGDLYPGHEFQFFFKLAGTPAGASDKGTDEGSRRLGMFKGFFRRNLHPVEELPVMGCQGGEGEVFRHYRSADEDIDVVKFSRYGRGGACDLSDCFSERAIEDEAQSTLFSGIIHQQNDAVLEDGISHGGRCQKYAACQS